MQKRLAIGQGVKILDHKNEGVGFKEPALASFGVNNNSKNKSSNINKTIVNIVIIKYNNSSSDKIIK